MTNPRKQANTFKNAMSIVLAMTPDQRANARHAWQAVCEDVDAALTYAEMKELRDFMLLSDLKKPVYGRFQFTPSHMLEDVAMILTLACDVRKLGGKDYLR